MTLSLCMIVKNEQENLPRCLESVKDIVDEIVIVDTGSTDSTIEIAKKYDAKIYLYEWNNNFSDARNYALDRSTCDWILLMDADDELDKEDKTKVLDLLNNNDVEAYFFETLSYVGNKPGIDIIMNLNARLIKNHKGYKFSGAIHEQIVGNIIKTNKDAKVKTEKIKIYHYGYLNKNVIEKDKRGRNIQILEDVLNEDKNDGFMLFNMGNEYFALQEYVKALEYYKNCFESFNPKLGYSPKLLIRMIMSYHEIGMYDEEIKMIDIGLSYYPLYTDLEYLRADLYYKQKNYTLAIASYQTCLKLGEPASDLNFIMGVGTYRAFYGLAKIFLDLNDYNEAYNCCLETLKIKSDFLSPFYMIGQIMFKRNENILKIKSNLEDFFKPNLDGPAYIVLADIFFAEQQYEVAYEYTVKSSKLLENSPQLDCFKGICLFFLKRFDESYECLSNIQKGEFYTKATYYMLLCKIVTNGEEKDIAKLVNNKIYKNDDTVKVYRTFKKLLEGKRCKPLSNDIDDSLRILTKILDLFDILLKIQEFEKLKIALQLLNLITNKNALLGLAKIYYKNNFYDLAYEEFVRSIKLFDTIDIEGLEMMQKFLAKK